MTAGDWLPIDDAANPTPKDGTRVRLWAIQEDGSEEETHGHYSSSLSTMVDDGGDLFWWCRPTHWQPIVGPKLNREGE